MRAQAALASIAVLALPACGQGDLGACDQEAAATLVYGRGNLVATAGQALVHDSCGNGGFCHSSRAEGGNRMGAPMDFDFDMLPEPTGWMALMRRRHEVWRAVDEGSMPPRGKAAVALGDTDWTFEADRAQGTRHLPSIHSAEGRGILRNWLACSAPIVRDTVLPRPKPPIAGAGSADAGSAHDGGAMQPEPTDFEPIFEEIVEPNCATAGCHDGTTRAGSLVMSDECGAFDGLLGAGPCEQARVVPGDPTSFLLEKLQSATPSCGSRMPLLAPLPQADIDRIADWVEQGARSNACE
jgi:hypothetical protein